MNRKWQYIDLLEGIIRLSELAQVFLQTMFIALGMPLILAGLIYVEYQGVASGALLFLPLDSATIIAFVFVTANIVIELFIVHREQVARYKRPERQAWSLRLILSNLGYRVGLGKDWQPRQRSPASGLMLMQTGIILTIFLLAFSGRLQAAIERVSDVPLGQGMFEIANASTLKDVLIWLGGTTMTMVAIFSARGIAGQIGRGVIEIKEDLKRQQINRKAQRTRANNKRATMSEMSNRLSVQTNNRQTGYGYSRQSSAVDKALAYLSDNPDALRLPVRDLGEAAGVGKDSAAKAKAQFNGNGHKSG